MIARAHEYLIMRRVPAISAHPGDVLVYAWPTMALVQWAGIPRVSLLDARWETWLLLVASSPSVFRPYTPDAPPLLSLLMDTEPRNESTRRRRAPRFAVAVEPRQLVVMRGGGA